MSNTDKSRPKSRQRRSAHSTNLTTDLKFTEPAPKRIDSGSRDVSPESDTVTVVNVPINDEQPTCSSAQRNPNPEPTSDLDRLWKNGHRLLLRRPRASCRKPEHFKWTSLRPVTNDQFNRTGNIEGELHSDLEDPTPQTSSGHLRDGEANQTRSPSGSKPDDCDPGTSC